MNINDCKEETYNTYFSHKIINDPIYGSIGLSEFEIALLNTRAMQRLRSITQMGFSSYVFPGAEHSRFSHSLGVLYIMGEICDQLYRNGKQISLKDVCTLRISALLHDIGHFPFSHLTECVYSLINSEKNINNIISDSHLEDNIFISFANHKVNKEYNHEHMGAHIINTDDQVKKLIEEYGCKPNLIGSIITGEVGITNESMVYAQLMHSSLDADRLDYLLRDSFQSGVVFGRVDINYIISCLKKVNLKVNDYSNSNLNRKIEAIAVMKKGQHAVEHFLMSRYFHYIQTVNQKTSVAFEAVAKNLIFKMLKKDNSNYKDIQSLIKIIGTDEFYSFNDHTLWNKLREFCQSSDADKLDKMMWETIQQRVKPKSIMRLKDIIPKLYIIGTPPVRDSKFFITKWILDHNLTEIAEKADINKDQIGYTYSSVMIESLPSYKRIEDINISSADEEDMSRDAIKLVNKENAITFLASDPTSLINKMVDYTADCINIFVIDLENSIDVQKLQNVINEMIII